MDRVWLPRADKSMLSIQKNIASQQHSILFILVQNMCQKERCAKNILELEHQKQSTDQRTRLWCILLDFVNRLSYLNYLNLGIPSSAHKILQPTNPNLATQKRDHKRISIAQLISEDYRAECLPKQQGSVWHLHQPNYLQKLSLQLSKDSRVSDYVLSFQTLSAL
ncbi:Hypothetical_protein [Hexamita inflata]|uniref:Hypothetical_protein n=1 Tax=Hexamita inflata TaxID=28002 RepID=A0AA86RAS6_9EUKA|nr:Hypothetical protein HINF_LOCUS62644 [Hexamita inflata]